MQLVFLSARPTVLAQTLGFWRAHAPFLDEVLVVAPARCADQLTALGVQVVTDEQLLRDARVEDHAARNYALRTALADSPAVRDVFVASDDDSRPLVPLPEDTWVRDGRHRRYHFGWLDDWDKTATSFDRASLAVRQVLALHGRPRLAYNAHQPQVLDKALLGAVRDELAGAAARHPLEEWSCYFNVAPTLAPSRFHDPEPYVTLGWPEDPSTWQPLLDPAALLFENFFAEHYAAGAVFDGIAPDDTSYDAAVDKVVRWRTYELEVLAGERPAALAPDVGHSKAGEALRRARAKAVGDPVLRDRLTRAAAAATVRAQRRTTEPPRA